ncbi:MAG: hypothetical protein KDI36_19165 [Pseudomonadales bacterium]|nr:hypothetical protein [Pseudomonadales bacterium]
MTDRLYLVDASIYFFRAFYSMPDNFTDVDGRSVNGVYGYAGFLAELVEKDISPVSFAFDESLTTCYRNTIYPAYKANRELPDENIKYQLAQCQRITSLLGFHSTVLEDYEADDIIGTLARGWREVHPETSRITIITRDKDLGQLLETGDSLWDYASDTHTDSDALEAKFGIRPEQLADYLALAGDAVDNIPGATGIGAKTAARLLQFAGNLEALLSSPEMVADSGIRGATKIIATLSEQAEEIRTYRRITSIHQQAPVTWKPEDFHRSDVDSRALGRFCDDMRFGMRLRERLMSAV